MHLAVVQHVAAGPRDPHGGDQLLSCDVGELFQVVHEAPRGRAGVLMLSTSPVAVLLLIMLLLPPVCAASGRPSPATPSTTMRASRGALRVGEARERVALRPQQQRGRQRAAE